MTQVKQGSQYTDGQGLGTLIRGVAAVAVAAPMLMGAAVANGQTAATADELSEVVITGDRLDVMQTRPVDSVFGFGKTVLETPRAVTTISSDLMTKTIITNINDLVALTPGSFTQSFFGVAGSLDVRGTPGENYFRGVKRIENPGNYPTPIGASESIAIVRGPASPIYGPSKVGGYLNFIPKSQKADPDNTSDPTGDAGVTLGSFSKKVLHAQVSGPSTLFGNALGYSLYGESENSNSYYQNSHTNQTIAQASFNLKLSDTLHSEFGTMYQNFKGNQVAGWNRLTQALIDNGTYTTGSPPNIDTNRNGLIDRPEYVAANLNPFIFNPNGSTPAAIRTVLAGYPNLALVNPGTAHLTGSQVLVAATDTLADNVYTGYFDLFADLPGDLKLVNKSFYENLDNINENAYGFSQYAKTYAFEDQFNLSKKLPVNDWFSTNVEGGASVRYQNFETGDDFAGEYFDRRDLTQPSSPSDARALATRGQSLYSDHIKGHYTDLGLSALADTAFFGKLNLLAGGRYDWLKMSSRGLGDALNNAGVVASQNKGAFSYSASLSYDLPASIVPYVTYAHQTTIITGQGGQIDPGSLQNGNAVGGSFLKEAGIKTTQLDGHLYAAVDYFIQERTDYNAQDTVSNNTTQAKGLEFELRYVVSPELTVTGAFTSMAVYNLTAVAGGTQFTFAGAADLLGVNPALIYGGSVGSVVPVSKTSGSLKAGLPKTLYSLNFMFSAEPWVPGLSASVAVTHSDKVYSGFTERVTLPQYTLVNAGVRYERGKWAVNGEIKNLTDQRYFRANFPDLFGNSVVLPELPRSFLLSGTFKF